MVESERAKGKVRKIEAKRRFRVREESSVSTSLLE